MGRGCCRSGAVPEPSFTSSLPTCHGAFLLLPPSAQQGAASLLPTPSHSHLPRGQHFYWRTEVLQVETKAPGKQISCVLRGLLPYWQHVLVWCFHGCAFGRKKHPPPLKKTYLKGVCVCVFTARVEKICSRYPCEKSHRKGRGAQQVERCDRGDFRGTQEIKQELPRAVASPRPACLTLRCKVWRDASKSA